MSVFDLMMAPSLSLAAAAEGGSLSSCIARARSKLTEAWSCPWCF